MTDEEDKKKLEDVLPMSRRKFLETVGALAVSEATGGLLKAAKSLSPMAVQKNLTDVEAVRNLINTHTKVPFLLIPDFRLKHYKSADVVEKGQQGLVSKGGFLSTVTHLYQGIGVLKHMQALQQQVRNTSNENYDICAHIASLQQDSDEAEALRGQLNVSGEEIPDELKEWIEDSPQALIAWLHTRLPQDQDLDALIASYQEAATNTLNIIKDKGWQSIFPEAESVMTDFMCEKVTLEQVAQATLMSEKRTMLSEFHPNHLSVDYDERMKEFHLTSFEDFEPHAEGVNAKLEELRHSYLERRNAIDRKYEPPKPFKAVSAMPSEQLLDGEIVNAEQPEQEIKARFAPDEEYITLTPEQKLPQPPSDIVAAGSVESDGTINGKKQHTEVAFGK